jgi:hypothetical protein
MAYVGESIGEWKTLIARKSPSQTRDRSEDVEERDEKDESHHDDKDVGGLHGLGCFPVHFDDGEAGRGVGNGIDIADAEENGDHECPLHDAVKRHSCNHAVWNSGSGSINFVACRILVEILLQFC